MSCWYCEGGISRNVHHGICHAEFERRSEKGVCTRCGEREAAGYYMCAACSTADDLPPFVGYPPRVA